MRALTKLGQAGIQGTRALAALLLTLSLLPIGALASHAEEPEGPAAASQPEAQDGSPEAPAEGAGSAADRTAGAEEAAAPEAEEAPGTDAAAKRQLGPPRSRGAVPSFDVAISNVPLSSPQPRGCSRVRLH